MRYKKLGKSALNISEIGFGCMSLEENPAQATVLLHKAIELGINYFDTADLYQQGRNEEMAGNALREKRKQVIIATKVGNQLRPDGKSWDWNPRKEYILAAVEKSLQRLQTDYIDLYQLHGGTMEDPIDESIEAFELLQQQGKIRYYGISSIRPAVIEEYVKRSHIVSVMMQYSLLDRRPEESCFDLLLKNNIGILSRGALAKGLLAGKPASTYLQHDEAAVAKAATAISTITPAGQPTSHTALRFVLQQPAITAAVTGIRTMAQLVEIAALDTTDKLDEKELATLKVAAPAGSF